MIPPHDYTVHADGIAPSEEITEHNSGAPTQDEYFADIDKMLEEADRLISEIAVPADELDVAAILATESKDLDEREVPDDPIPSPPNDDKWSSPDMLADGDMEGQQPIERGFRCVTYNAQKSRKNVHYFLEKHIEDVDVVFIQEPPWRFTKKVPSSTNKEGDDYEHTVSHREFILIGAAKENRVTTYYTESGNTSHPNSTCRWPTTPTSNVWNYPC